MGETDEKGDPAAAIRAEAEREIVKVEAEIVGLKKLLQDVKGDWTDEKNRVIGHVVLSPPITLDYANDGFTDDWAVTQVESSMIAKFNLVGNVIDLRSVTTEELKAWMYPRLATLRRSNTLATVFFNSPAWSQTRRCIGPIRGTKTRTTTRSLWCSRTAIPLTSPSAD